ncbi:MAG: VOC family protein [Acidimicrobiales bacterium]|uniref:VOC family protein n=1 Tax=Candidatus Poriferisodalis multihospitum TaxID=2983191 RepID=UPI00137D9B23|nr:VOC family protein [Candidatus Poriferisodalis multihospitum]MDE0320655.1 VOC family protein [Acidimicrobiaceae bacterium]MXY02610.1 VOC family protein [Acidimicrobiales bacterium]MYG87877.1 VOC family protein [Acidimicrobiales bacterium]MYI29577.1 VOC family protein [Acidimicrobiales bacterium]
MIDYQRLFHTGIRVPDLDAAMAEMGETLGVSWASVQHNAAQQVWTPQQGLQSVELTFTYSREGPQHLELLQGQSGTIWDGSDDPGVHHVGVWVDDVAAETERCLHAGWKVAAAAAPPDDGYGVFAYVVPPSGPIVELVWSAIEQRFESWWSGGRLGSERD